MADRISPPIIVRQATRWLLDLFYPPRCAGCGRFGSFFCPLCDSRTLEPATGVCAGCGRAHLGSGFCGACRHSYRALSGVFATALFTNPIRPALLQLKYNGVTAMAEPLAERLSRLWLRQGLQADVVIPVPLHASRLFERGYNQAALLGEILSKRVGVDYNASALARTRATRPQVHLSRSERLRNVDGAFIATRPLVGMRVLLIDDVCTTGATLESAARALTAKGAQTVWGLTVARAGSDFSADPLSGTVDF
jgi:ComF family protein